MKIIIILSGGIKKDSDGRWHSTDLTEKDAAYGSPGGYLRVLAAKYLLGEDPDSFIIAAGGRGYDIKDHDIMRPDISQILKDELIDLDVPSEKIAMESESNNTYGQLVNAAKILSREQYDSAMIITNKYHLQRVKAMIEYINKQESNKYLIKSKLIDAEEILVRFDEEGWKDKIEKMYSSVTMKEIIKKERQGIRDLKAGKYKLKL